MLQSSSVLRPSYILQSTEDNDHYASDQRPRLCITLSLEAGDGSADIPAVSTGIVIGFSSLVGKSALPLLLVDPFPSGDPGAYISPKLPPFGDFLG